MKSRLKSILQNLILLGIGIIAALVIAEIGVRLLVPEYQTAPHPRGMYVPNRLRGYALTPGFSAPLESAEFQTTVKINEQGLRERDLGPKAANTYRILVLGDSFTFGQGIDVEKTFPRLLEAELATYKPEVDWEVINAGVPGYGTDQELLLLEEVGWSYSPDLVIVCLFAGNDVYDNHIGGAVRRSVRNGYLYDEYQAQQKATRSPIVGPVTSWLSLYSRLYVFLRTQFDAMQWAGENRIPVPMEHLDALRVPPSAQFSEGMAVTEAVLGQMAAQVAQHGATLLVVLIPSAVQVDDMLWEKALDLYNLSATEYDREQPCALFAEFGHQADVEMLDLLPAFRAANPGVAYYFDTDIHWTAEGHRVAAIEIGRYLEQNSWFFDPF